ncbi:phosphatase PAP2 family protein [Aerophototrophica crusticola]|uniref:Phosphatase PAP2 family protein n=1 Tax=Aerophototrophica crusticola TaxID=1709002 RepID=A0A858R8R6_9PROT|nr:phosphatase PAP2 family protein [Rhodospirillaceae bacterium B3]
MGTYLTDNPLTRADLRAARAIHPHRHHGFLQAAADWSELTDQEPLFAGAAGLMALAWASGYRAEARKLAHVLGALAAATLLKDGMKRSVARSRPVLLHDKGIHRVRLRGKKDKSWHSLPSGHAAGAAAVAAAVARAWPAAALPAYLAAGLLSAARMPTGLHYPSDVAAGVAVGLVAEGIVQRLWPASP